jgi:hypothetical protein
MQYSSPNYHHLSTKFRNVANWSRIIASVVAEWFGRRTLNQVWIPAKARRGICEQDTLKSTARPVAIIRRIACGIPLASVKKITNEMPVSFLDRTHVPNMHIIMRRRLLWQLMAVTMRQPSASASSILIWGSVWGFPRITEISVRKFKIRFISEVLVNSVNTI